MNLSRLDFALRFVDGRGVLGLTGQLALDWVGVERLDLTVPNLHFPFDASLGTSRFQSRRCELDAVELRVSEPQLQKWVDGRLVELERYGIERLKVRLRSGRIDLSGRIHAGDRESPFIANVALFAETAQRVSARIVEVRLYAPLPVAAPQVALALGLGLAGEPSPPEEPGAAARPVTVRGAAELSFNPLELLLWQVLPPSGWRLPRYQDAHLAEVRVEDGGVVLGYSSRGEAAPEVPTLATQERRAAEALIVGGDLAGAAERCLALAQSTSDPTLAETALAIEVARPARWPEAEALAGWIGGQWPERLAPLLALGAIDAGRGRYTAAAVHYVRVHELAARQHEDEDAALAAARAGELFALESPAEAIPWLERSLARAQGDIQTANLLAEAYTTTQRWRDLVGLARWRLSSGSVPGMTAALQATVARVLLEELDEPLEARDELEKALRGQEGDAELWALYAEALRATGDEERAREAIERATARSDGLMRASLELRASELAEKGGNLSEALARAQAAIAAAPQHPSALERTAALLARLGRLDEATATYEDAVLRAEAGHDDAMRASLLTALARLALRDLHDPNAARTYLQRALAVAPSVPALELAAELTEAEGRLEELVALLAQLAELDAPRARLRQAEALERLGRHEAAIAAAKSTYDAHPLEAGVVLCRAYEALGDLTALRAALIEQVTRTGSCAARLRLSALERDAGDLPAARRLLEEAMSGAVGDDLRRVRWQLAELFTRLGEDDALEGVLEGLSACEDERERARALTMRGSARLRLCRLREAFDDYRAALPLLPEEADVEARTGLGQAAMALGQWDEARAALEPLFRRGLPPAVARALELAEIARRQARAEDAVTFFEAALAAGASEADAVRAHDALIQLCHTRADLAGEARARIRAADDVSSGELPVVRAARLVAAADLLRKRLQRRDEAIDCLERALELDPLQLSALDALEGMAAQIGDREEVARILGRKVAATAKRPADQRAILGRLGALQAQLGRADAARAAYERALTIDPAFRPALTWLASDAQGRGDSAAEMQALTTLTALPPDPQRAELSAPFATRLATLLFGAGRYEEAEVMVRRALGWHTRAPEALALLDRLLSRRPASTALAEVLAMRAEVETEFTIITDILARHATTLEAVGETGQALAAYQRLLATNPGSIIAFERLAELYRAREQWGELAELFLRQAVRHRREGREPVAEALYEALVELSRTHASPTEERARLQRMTTLAPHSAVALDRALELARADHNLDEEEALLTRLAERTTGSERGERVWERAQLRQRREDIAGCLALLRELDPEEAPTAALHLRAELEELHGAPGQVVQALSALHLAAVERRDVVEERWALSRLFQTPRFLPNGSSLELARRALVLAPEERDAAQALLQAARQAGDEPGQLEALNHLARIARARDEGAAREAELAIARAELQARAGDGKGALALLSEALERHPDETELYPAFAALARAQQRLYAVVATLQPAGDQGRLDAEGWSQLGQAHRDLGDEAAALAALRRAGTAAPAAVRAQLSFADGRLEEARDAAKQALAKSPRDSELRRIATHGMEPAAVLALAEGLESMLDPVEAAGLYASIAQELPSASPEQGRALERAAALQPSAAALLRLATRSSGALAVEHYRAALALDSECIEAIAGIAKEAAPSESLPLIETAWHATSDPARRARLALAWADVVRTHDCAPVDVAAALTALGLVVAETAGLADAPTAALARAEVALAVVAGATRRAETALERLRGLGAANDVELRHLGELLHARGEHEAVVELLWPLEGLPAALDEALVATGRLDELALRLYREARRKPPYEGRALYLRAATLYADSLDNPRRAVEILEELVPQLPADGEIWARLGHLNLERLGRPGRGAECLARAYAADPHRVDVLLPLARYHDEAHEVGPAEEYYKKALDGQAVPEREAAPVCLRLAEYAAARRDGVHEEELLGRAAKLGSQEAWARLCSLYRARGSRTELAEALLERAAREASGEARVPLLREAAPLVDVATAARLDEQILALDPNDEATRERVLARLRGAGDPRALVERLEQELATSPPTRRSSYLREIGRVATAIGDHTRAEQAWSQLLDESPCVEAALGLWERWRTERAAIAGPRFAAALADPRLPTTDQVELAQLTARAYLTAEDSTGALNFLDQMRAAGVEIVVDGAARRRALRSTGRLTDLLSELDRARAAARDLEEGMAFELEAAELCERELNQPRGAARRYQQLFERHPSRLELATRARRAYIAGEQPEEALAISERELKLVQDPDALAELRVARAGLLLAKGAEAEAEAELLHALITTPRSGAAHAGLAALCSRRGDRAGLIEHLTAAAAAPDPPPPEVAGHALAAADTLLREGNLATAERLYDLAMSLDATAQRPIDALARLAADRGDWERQAALLGRQVALVPERRGKAELSLARARAFEALGRELDAYRAYKEAAAYDPTLREAIGRLIELAAARGDWLLAAEQLGHALEQAESDDERALLHLRIAQVKESHLFDGPAALHHYEEALARIPKHGQARKEVPWSSLVRLYAQAQMWVKAAEAAGEWVETLSTTPDDVPALTEALARAAELHRRTGDEARAVAYLTRAAALTASAAAPVAPESEARRAALRERLSAAVERHDEAAIDECSRALLAEEPSSHPAFVARRHLLTTRQEPAALAALLRERANHSTDPREVADLRFDAGRLHETLDRLDEAAHDYEAALAAVPEHLPALDAFADLSYRRGDRARARSLYAALTGQATTIAADELTRRRAELAEAGGDLIEARELYRQATRIAPTYVAAQEALARLALATNDHDTAYQALRAVLELVPLDAVERITELRRQLGDLALRLHQPAAARHYLELVLAQLPTDLGTLERLVQLYLDEALWREAADALERWSRLVRDPAERATLLYRRGEALRIGLGDFERASDSYLKAADLCPTHAPTLRQLIAYYYAEGDFASLKEVTRDLERLGQPLDSAACEAGLGLALGGDEARGTVMVTTARPTTARLAELLAGAQVASFVQLDPALRAALRALGNDGRTELQAALERIAEPSATLQHKRTAHLALGRLHDSAGDLERARVHYAIVAYLEPSGPAATRADELGPSEPLPLNEEACAHPRARGPLRDVLTALAPLIVGVPAGRVAGEEAPALEARLRPWLRERFKLERAELLIISKLAEPAWAEPTLPVRLSLSQRLAGKDDGLIRFALARALSLLDSGVALIEERAPDEVMALLYAAAMEFVPGLSPPLSVAAFVQQWRAMLSRLPVALAQLDEERRRHLAQLLSAAVADPRMASGAADYCAAERLSADRRAWATTGDLRAGLRLLAGEEETAPTARLARLASGPAAELIAFALATSAPRCS